MFDFVQYRANESYHYNDIKYCHNKTVLGRWLAGRVNHSTSQIQGLDE